MIKFTENIKQLWIAGLRDPEVVQTTGALCEEKEGKLCYCGIGVLGKVLLEAGVAKTKGYAQVEVYNLYGDDPDYLMDAYDIIYKVQHTDDSKKAVTGPSLTGAIATMNDKEGKTLPEIADWIETYVKVEE